MDGGCDRSVGICAEYGSLVSRSGWYVYTLPPFKKFIIRGKEKKILRKKIKGERKEVNQGRRSKRIKTLWESYELGGSKVQSNLS